MPEKLPYPGFNPSFRNVKKRRGLSRNVLVLEVLTKTKIKPASKALIIEQVEAKLSQLMGKNGLIEFDLITEDRFDVLLQEGLRYNVE